MRSFPILAAILSLGSSAAAQSINDRPSITAIGQGEVTRPPDFARVGFQVRGEGANSTEALAGLARQRAEIEAGIRSLKGLSAVGISTVQVNTQDVRSPNCSRTQPYLANQQLSTGDCAVIGAIATLETEVKVFPAARAGDVASMASQLGAKTVGVRGSGFRDDAALTQEAVAKAALDARRQAEAVARAAGVHLGPMLRLQDSTISLPQPLMAYEDAQARMQALSPPAPPPPLAVPLSFAPQPITRTARVTATYALEPGSGTP